jgi:hypothetical protein
MMSERWKRPALPPMQQTAASHKEKRQPERDGCRFSHYARNDRGDAGLIETGWGEI